MSVCFKDVLKGYNLPPTIKNIGMYGSAGQSWKYTLPMTIIQKGMTTVILHAIVHPIVPKRSSVTFSTKSITFLEALCVSLILPNKESYEGGSAETYIYFIILKLLEVILSG